MFRRGEVKGPEAGRHAAGCRRCPAPQTCRPVGGWQHPAGTGTDGGTPGACAPPPSTRAAGRQCRPCDDAC